MDRRRLLLILGGAFVGTVLLWVGFFAFMAAVFGDGGADDLAEHASSASTLAPTPMPSPSQTLAPEPAPSATPSPAVSFSLVAPEVEDGTSLFQTAMGRDAPGMMVVEDGHSQKVGNIAFDIPAWWDADVHVPGGYAELVYFGDPGDSPAFGFGVGQPQCDGDVDACIDARVNTLTGGNRDGYSLDVVHRPGLRDGKVVLLSKPSSEQNSGWTAVAFVDDGKDLYEFLIGDTKDLASVLAAIDSVRGA